MRKRITCQKSNIYILGYLKRIFAGIVIATTLLSTINQTYAAEIKKEITVDIDGKFLSFDQPPILENGRVLVPMRVIFEALGATVEWHLEEQRVKAVKETDTSTLLCTITIPDKLLYVNYTDTQDPDNLQRLWFYSDLDVAPKIVNGRTLVPARAVAEAFGATVTWDGNAQAVHISMVNAKIVDPKTGKSIDVLPSDTVPIPTPKPTEQAKADEPFNLKVGDIAGNIVKDPNDYDSNYAKTFTDAYRLGSIGQCTWYAESRFYEIYGYRLPFDLGSAKEWLENAKNKDQLITITNLSNIESKTIAVYKDTEDLNSPGHVLFIEHVERDSAGNPQNIYFTEANMGQDGTYVYGRDGTVQMLSFDKFKKRGTQELIGYIAPK